MPLISVITVVYNDKEHIEDTIKSVLELKDIQKNVEYIVIDGNSNDGTWDIIRKYSSNIDYIKSEPDSGIYNAMNKAIEHISGDWCIFINSGDKITYNALDIFNNDISEDVGILYGDVYLCFNKRMILKEATKETDKLPSFFHQAAFIKSSLMKKWKYDEKYKICADYNFFKKLYDNGYKIQYIDYPVAFYDMDGTSANNLLLFCKERRVIGDKISNYSYFKFWLRSKINILFPKLYYNLFYFVYSCKYRKETKTKEQKTIV